MKEVKVGSIVLYIGKWYRVTKVSKTTVNLGSIFGKTIYHKAVDKVMVAEDEESWYKMWQQSETYKCM